MVNALGDRNPDLRIFSHWGITGSNTFVDAVSHTRRERMKIRVLQTCGLKRESEGSDVLRAAIASGVPEASSLTDIPAATGFVHGYDLGKILIYAARQASATPEWQGDITDRRRALKQALETLDAPVMGILKQYNPPFERYSAKTPDAHEALGLDDLCLARFLENGHLADAN
jgi:branched-chain amino acid transport system substrate-binding protein